MLFPLPFNRTIVELKCIQMITPLAIMHSFNRTIVELKFTYDGGNTFYVFLLIVP